MRKQEFLRDEFALANGNGRKRKVQIFTFARLIIPYIAPPEMTAIICAFRSQV